MQPQSRGDVGQKDWRRSLEESIAAFDGIVKPEAEKLIGGRIARLEGLPGETALQMDRDCGIDYMVRYPDGRMDTLATRVQFGHNYGTFTVRRSRATGTPTEYLKRARARAEGSLLPRLALQAYVKEGSLVGLAVCETVGLLDMIEKGLYENGRTGKKQNGQADFYIVYWWQMHQEDCWLLRWLPPLRTPGADRATGTAPSAVDVSQQPSLF